MKREEIICIIIKALQDKKVIESYHIMQKGKAVQIKIKDGAFYNILTVKMPKDIGKKFKK